MVQTKQLLAPAILFAAGSFAGSADAAVFVDNVDISPTAHGTLIGIGVPTSDAQYGFASLHVGFKSFASVDGLNGSGVMYEGDLSTSPYIPDASTTFNSSVKTAGLAGSGSGYLGLRFDVGSDTIFGYATVDQNGWHISQFAYDAADRLTITARAVPEAATWAEMILGLGAAGAVMRRRRQRAGALSA